MSDLIDRQAAIEVAKKLLDYYGTNDISKEFADHTAERFMNWVPSAEPERNNHTVACLLAEVFGDTCACNFNGIDEWLPKKCEVIDSCPLL